MANNSRNPGEKHGPVLPSNSTHLRKPYHSVFAPEKLHVNVVSHTGRKLFDISVEKRGMRLWVCFFF